MGARKYLALLAILATTLVSALPEDIERRKKAIGIFNLVQFPNDECEASSTQTGTCYTAEECSSRSGVASGTCADGYGVCCVITLACGGSSAENGTYLTQTAATADCTYTICPRDATINRIKLDLTTFQIGSPVAPADVTGDASATTTAANRAAVGHCTTDSFSVTGAPTICGTNNGQHMFVDTDGTACVKASFSFGGTTARTSTRNYNIQVRQYAKSNMDGGGRAGCLQWFTGNTGTVKSFNWQGTGAASTHLANQKYNVCVRKNVGFRSICWNPTSTGAFGLSNGASGAAAAKSGAGTSCPGTQTSTTNPTDSADFVFIAGAGDSTTSTAPTSPTGGRVCGRFFSASTTGSTSEATICSRITPFQLSVHTDGIEAANAGGAMADKNEVADGTATGTLSAPLGTIGFELSFYQSAN